MTFINLTGLSYLRDEAKKSYDAVKSEIDKNVEDTKAAIDEKMAAEKKGDEESVKRSQERIDQLKKEADTLKYRASFLKLAAEKGKDVNIANALPMMGGAAEMIQHGMQQIVDRRYGGSFEKAKAGGGGSDWVVFLREMQTITGMTEEQLMEIESTLEKTQGTISGGLSKLSSNLSGVRLAIGDITAGSTDTEKKTAVDNLINALPGMATDQAESIVNAMQFPEFKDKFMALLNNPPQLKTGGIDQGKFDQTLASIAKQTGVGLKIAKKNLKVDVAASANQVDSYNKTFAGVRDQTLSLTDMIAIGKDGAQYGAAMLTRVDKISKWVNDLVGFAKMDHGGKSISEESAGRQYDKLADGLKGGQTELGVILKNNNPKMQLTSMEKLLEKDLKKAAAGTLSDAEQKKIDEEIKMLTNLIDYLKDSGRLTDKDIYNAHASAEKEATQSPLVMQQGQSPWMAGLGEGWSAIPPAKKANLRSPETVRTAGLVGLDPGETIMPSKSAKLFRENTSTNTSKPAPSQNITISVNATEKDLAQRIANEVRGVLYQNSINGKG